VWAVIAAIALWAVSAAAQEGGGMPAADQLVRASAAPVTVAAGGRAVVHVKLEVLPGWHVNANPPALDYNIATTVSLTDAHGLTAGRARYPKGKRQKFGFEDTPLLVYDGTTEVSVPLTAALDAASGRLTGKVAFQGCNDELCLQPASVPFEVAVTVTAAAAGPALSAEDSAALAQPEPAAAARDAATFATTPPTGGMDATGQRARLESALAGGGIGWFLALFAGGLLLNLTPCVFPMIGVTVSIFGARQREALPKAMTSAILYVLGICLTYTVLGVVAALTGGLFGAALQNVWVMVALGGAMIVLSLGMFGVYEMQPPGWVMNRLGGASATSFAGSFLSGLGVGIIAAPCVGPFVVAVLALIAQRGDVGFGLGTMFTLSLGLGFPYLFLATFSNLLTALPRSGDWMVWVKHVFGAIMVAFGLYFVSLGVAPTVTPWVLPVSLVVGGILLGFVDPSAGPRGRFRAFAQSLGLLAVVAGIVPATMMIQAQMRTLTFQAYDPVAVQASLAAGRPVMMDFSADWCIPCHEMEVTTLSDPRVVAAARKFDRYKVDLTKYDSPEADASRKRYAIAGVPTIVFLAADGREIAPARVEGYLAVEPFLERLRLGEAR
jgi:thiol:disulfide interchange protein DsbD